MNAWSGDKTGLNGRSGDDDTFKRPLEPDDCKDIYINEPWSPEILAQNKSNLPDLPEQQPSKEMDVSMSHEMSPAQGVEDALITPSKTTVQVQGSAKQDKGTESLPFYLSLTVTGSFQMILLLQNPLGVVHLI